MFDRDKRDVGSMLFQDEAIPQNTSITSAALPLAKVQGGIELVVVAETAINLADTKSITITLKHAPLKGGTFVDVHILYTVTASGATVIPAGTELGRFVPHSKVNTYISAVMSSTDAAVTGTVTLYGKMVVR